MVYENARKIIFISLPSSVIRVLEFGGSCNTKSLYFQGGDAKRRHEVYSVVARMGEDDPTYRNSLVRMLVFREGNNPVRFQPILDHSPQVSDLTLFGWEYVRVEPKSWANLSRALVSLELVGIGFNTEDVKVQRNTSVIFNCDLFSAAKELRVLKIAGWGDTKLDMATLLTLLPDLHTLYLEDVKIGFAVKKPVNKTQFNHSLSELSIFHCSTRDVDLVQSVCAVLPNLTSLTVSSLYLDDPNRGLPFHFHMPQGEEGAVPRHPLADLTVISEHAHLEKLHLNINYPPQHLGNIF